MSKASPLVRNEHCLTVMFIKDHKHPIIFQLFMLSDFCQLDEVLTGNVYMSKNFGALSLFLPEAIVI